MAEELGRPCPCTLTPPLTYHEVVSVRWPKTSEPVGAGGSFSANCPLADHIVCGNNKTNCVFSRSPSPPHTFHPHTFQHIFNTFQLPSLSAGQPPLSLRSAVSGGASGGGALPWTLPSPDGESSAVEASSTVAPSPSPSGTDSSALRPPPVAASCGVRAADGTPSLPAGQLTAAVGTLHRDCSCSRDSP